MTEDYSAQRPSAVPYIGIGGVAGGVGGYFAADKVKKLNGWVSEPGSGTGKYKDFQDLVNEKEDEFVKKMEEVEDKDLVQKAKDARTRIAEGEAQWDKELQAYMDANKVGATAGTSEGLTNAEKGLEDARKALETKRQQLVDDEVARLTKANEQAGQVTLSPKAQRALQEKEDLLAQELKKYEKMQKSENAACKDAANRYADVVSMLEDKKADAEKAINDINKSTTLTAAEKKAKIKEIQDSVKNVQTEFNKEWQALKGEISAGLDTELPDNLMTQKNKIDAFKSAHPGKELPKDLKKAQKGIDSWKEGMIKEYEQYFQDVTSERMFNQAQRNNVVKTIAKDRQTATQAIKDSMTKGRTIPENATQEELLKIVSNEKQATQMKLDKLTKFSEAYEKYATEAAGSTTSTSRTFKIEFDNKIRRFLFGDGVTITETEGKELKAFVDTLPKEEKAAFERLVKEAPDGDIKKALENSTKGLNEKVKGLEQAAGTLERTGKQIVELGGEGAVIRDGKIFDAAGKKVTIKPKTVKIAENVEIPKPESIGRLERAIEKIKAEAGATGEKLTPEQILEKAKGSIKEEMLATENGAVKTAEQLVETEKGKLPKITEAKTEEVLKKEFIEKNGERGAKVTETVKKDLSDSLKGLFEKASKNKGRMAAIIGGGAVLGALIALIFRPKAKQS